MQIAEGKMRPKCASLPQGRNSSMLAGV